MPITIPGTENMSDQQKAALFGNTFNPMTPVRAAMRATVSDQDVANQQAQDQATTDRLKGMVGALQGDITAATQGPTTQKATLAPQDAAQQQSAEDQATQAQAQQAAATAQAQGGGVVPDASDPAAAISQMNTNISRGVGDASGNVSLPAPTPPSLSQQQSQQLAQTGKQASFDENKIPVWYKSSSFNMGLISFGLNLLSGNDLGTSFARAGQAFTDMYGQEKRQAYAQELAQQGYSTQEIMEWIQTGNSKALVNPAEKAAKLAQEQAQAKLTNANAYKAQVESSPEYLQWKMGSEQRKSDLEEQRIKASILNSQTQAKMMGLNQQLGLERLELDKRNADRLDQQWKDKMQMASDKANNAIEGDKSRMQIVSNGVGEANSIGKELLASDGIGLTGSNLLSKGQQWWSKNVSSANNIKNISTKMDEYNSRLTNIGQSQLYLEANGNRIFAKEMETAGKQLRPLDISMTKEQIRENLAHNATIMSKLDDRARQVTQGKTPHSVMMANKQVYNSPEFANEPPINTNGR